MAAVGCLAWVSAAHAVLLDTRSNYMGPDWSGAWANVANWVAVTPYSPELNDHGGGGIDQVSMAHDDTYLYFYIDQASGFNFEVGAELMFFDTDLNFATGTNSNYWWGSAISVGAEITLNGAVIVETVNPAFNGVDNWVYVDPSHANGNYEYLIQVSRAKFANPAAFDWDMTMFAGPGDDYYPNFGDHHRYVVIPEPAAAVLAALGLISRAAMGRRKSF